MNDNACNAEKRTLLSAKVNLQRRIDELAELARMSETLIAKFERTEGKPKEECGKEDTSVVDKQPDLIGMFERLSDELGGYINRIGNNLERALNTID